VDRYKVARAQGKYQQVVEEDNTLLQEFGLGLLSVDSGLRVVVKKSLRDGHIHPWDVIPVHPKLWGWLRPLLVELAEFRRAKKKKGLNGDGANGVKRGAAGKGSSRHGSISLHP